ncbi:MAG: DUF4145 domain-containing protein [Dehalococcoidia bacterium]|nr:DUF4145 domain-containing protein [Dehalococcoidia bacterium]
MVVELDILQSADELLGLLDLLENEMAFTCPNCEAKLADASWLDVLFARGGDQSPTSRLESIGEDWDLGREGEIPIERLIAGRWLDCLECHHVLVRFTQIRRQPSRDKLPRDFEILGEESWLVIPRHSARSVHAEVGKAVPYLARLYQEAASILDESPSASAVLSRRVLADLLKKYAKREEFGLPDRINKFNEDTSHPSGLRENLHHLREIANFGAHTQEDDQASIVDVDRHEAEWTLDLVDRLFDYFIITPARDKEMRAKMDKKIDAVGRKPIKPPEDPGK